MITDIQQHLLDILLVMYIVCAFWFKWSGKISLWGGVTLLAFAYIRAKIIFTPSTIDIFLYAWVFIATGIALIIYERLMWHKKIFSDFAGRSKNGLVVISDVAYRNLRIGVTRYFTNSILRSVQRTKETSLKFLDLMRSGWRWFRNYPYEVQLKIFGLAIFTLPILFFLQWNVVRTALIIFFIGGSLFSLDSRFVFRLALACIILTPLFLIVKSAAWAEGAAVTAFEFLTMGIVYAVGEAYREARHKRRV